MALGQFPPGQLPPDNYHPSNSPQDNYPHANYPHSFNHIQPCILCFISAKRLYIYRAVASFFPIRGLKSQRNFYSQSCTNILRILTKNSAPQGKIESLRLSDTLKLSTKKTKRQKEMYL